MPPHMWNIDEIKGRGFRTGSILRVQMHNFITYDDAEVFPGPRLNIILGPNGTGKSTLTHAICLACAGVPSSVGRSDDLRHFIKRGKEGEGCFCEVDLLLKNDAVVTVRRTLNSETKGSKWQLNHKSATQKEIKELMSSLHIDVDNLCSFMPQDRVSAFTQMNSKKLLQSTLECIKTPNGGNLYEEQQYLAGRQDTTNKKERDVDAVNKDLITTDQQIRGMQGEVDRIRNRDKLREKLTMYNVRLAVLMLEEKAAEVNAKQAEIDEENKNLVDAQATVKPLEMRVSQLQREQVVFEKSIKSVLDKKVKADERLDIARERIDELDIEVESAKLNIESYASTRRVQEEKLRTMNMDLQRLDEQYQSSMQNVPEWQSQLKTSNEQFEAASCRVSEVSDQLNTLKFDLRAPQSEAQKFQTQLNKIKDPRDVFFNKLNGKDRDVIKAAEWISEYRHRLRGECYGPVAAEVTVHSQEDAAMLEHLVSFPKLKTLLVDNKEDENLLNNELRGRLKLSVNITTIHNKQSTQPPFSREFLQNAKEKYGFESFLGDKFDMPDMVRSYLNVFIGIQHVLCTRGPNASKLMTHQELLEFSRITPSSRIFAIDTDPRGNVKDVTYFTSTKSRFARDSNDLPSTTSVSVKSPRFLGTINHTESQQHKAQLEESLARARKDQQLIEEEITRLRQVQQALQVERDEHRNISKKLKNSLSQPEVMKKSLMREEKRRDELARKLEGGSGQQRQELVDLYRAKLTELMEAVTEIHQRCDTALEATVWKDFTSRSSRGKKDEIYEAKESLEEAKARFQHIRDRVKDLEIERKAAHDLKIDSEKVIEKLEVELGSEEKLNEFFVRATKEISETTREALTTRRDQIEGQFDATVDNPELLAQYDRLKETASELAEKHTKLVAELTEMNDSASTRNTAFYEHVRTIIAKLNVDFSRFMKELHFAGEVNLKEQSGFMDFEVTMRVNFHSDTQSGLQPLSGQSHSGGERSVSTVMYLMALQELTSAPFRVVDEINQGMDERNERLVFDRIVRSCCSRPTNSLSGACTSASSSSSSLSSSSSSSSSSSQVNGTPVRVNGRRTAATPPTGGSGTGETGPTVKAQYFLVSPKLLPGLRAMDNDDVTALMVYNGPGVKDLWQMGDIISALQKRKHELLSDGN